jgi:hypothetical protein
MSIIDTVNAAVTFSSVILIFVWLFSSFSFPSLSDLPFHLTDHPPRDAQARLQQRGIRLWELRLPVLRVRRFFSLLVLALC